MDELIAMCRQFDSLSDDANELSFALHFSRVIQKVTDLLMEVMMDQRDVRDTNEFYALIFSNISQLRDNLSRYMTVIFENEIQQMNEERERN